MDHCQLQFSPSTGPKISTLKVTPPGMRSLLYQPKTSPEVITWRVSIRTNPFSQIKRFRIFNSRFYYSPIRTSMFSKVLEEMLGWRLSLFLRSLVSKSRERPRRLFGEKTTLSKPSLLRRGRSTRCGRPPTISLRGSISQELKSNFILNQLL